MKRIMKYWPLLRREFALDGRALRVVFAYANVREVCSKLPFESAK
jgi:hypothetical protein